MRLSASTFYIIGLDTLIVDRLVGWEWNFLNIRSNDIQFGPILAITGGEILEISHLSTDPSPKARIEIIFLNLIMNASTTNRSQQK